MVSDVLTHTPQASVYIVSMGIFWHVIHEEDPELNDVSVAHRLARKRAGTKPGS